MRELLHPLLQASLDLGAALVTDAIQNFLGVRVNFVSAFLAVASPDVRTESLAKRTFKLEVLEKKHVVEETFTLTVANVAWLGLLLDHDLKVHNFAR